MRSICVWALLLTACLQRQVIETPRPPAAPDQLTVTFLDVKQGDAILVQLGTADLLVDAGPRAGCQHLKAALGRVRGALEFLFITHPHDDHYGCAAQILKSLPVGRVITNGERRGPPRDEEDKRSWAEFEQAARRRGLGLEPAVAGDVITPAPGLGVKVLSSGGEFEDTDEGTDINNDSLTLMLSYAGRRILLTGDVENDADEMLIERYCRDGKPNDCPELHADVLKVPHHGSARFAPAFFEAVKPVWAVLSADYNSKKHHLPRTDPIRALQSLGSRVFSTSAEGEEDVVLTVSPAGATDWRVPHAPLFAWERRGHRYVGVTMPQ